MLGVAGLQAGPTLVTMLRTVTATRYVTPLREGGSVPALVEADDDGLYVVKLLGAGHGRKALVAELLTGAIAVHLGLPVPDLVLVELDGALAKAEPDGEIRDLLARSAGTNFGLDFLPGALAFAPAVGPKPHPDLAAETVWLDAFTTNVDRTARNPNLIVWHRRLHLIDHGSALYIHHTWAKPDEHARRPFPQVRDHVLLPFASSIEAADERLAARLDREVLEMIAAGIPDDWLPAEGGLADPDAHRRAYVDYLAARLAARRAFVEEAERARVA
jgi:HipA-like kinase